jgi:Ni,Fe-hydrogenase III small subunit
MASRTQLSGELMFSIHGKKVSILRGIFTTPVTDPAENPPPQTDVIKFRGSLQLRHVDVGSCNGCEVEIASALGPIYDASRFGARLVASPRHADGVLVTGIVTKNMLEPLQRTVDAVPNPRVVVACGDCAVSGGIFNGAYGSAGRLDEFLPIDVAIPGCPPHPDSIIRALRTLTGR